ncbi:hypothetical protein [Hydrogenophaga sp. PML113]|uniref:hypothetical protein n=1 Tax=Hydrogenophaga sp. PML113 TaxID=1899350 RepID=UPI0020C7B635|nr:hypothetical protein [Hydrogenophaga sp. PML113]
MALRLANRFRVIRTIDVAVGCFAERPFKAALTAAQRAMRGMVKDDLLRRYRTDRFQTVYGLTGKGADWLANRGVDASSSVRRVSDMSNPEHRLWAQFLTLCCEARGLRAHTEQELMVLLAKNGGVNDDTSHGLLNVLVTMNRGSRRIELRPDAVAIESDGVTWLEVDRSARGADRAASLKALALSAGRTTRLGVPLRRVVVLTRSPRIENRVRATLDALAQESAAFSLSEGRRILVPGLGGAYTVIRTREEVMSDGRTRLVDETAGYVLVQALPVWLPKVRLDGRDGHACDGWFDVNYLPYQRIPPMEPWRAPGSPLHSLVTQKGA